MARLSLEVARCEFAIQYGDEGSGWVAAGEALEAADRKRTGR